MQSAFANELHTCVHVVALVNTHILVLVHVVVFV